MTNEEWLKLYCPELNDIQIKMVLSKLDPTGNKIHIDMLMQENDRMRAVFKQIVDWGQNGTD